MKTVTAEINLNDVLGQLTDDDLKDEAKERGFDIVESGEIHEYERIATLVIEGRIDEALDCIDTLSGGKINIPSIKANVAAIRRE